MGTPAFHPIDESLSMGTPAFHPNLAPGESPGNRLAVLLVGADQRNGQYAGTGSVGNLK